MVYRGTGDVPLSPATMHRCLPSILANAESTGQPDPEHSNSSPTPLHRWVHRSGNRVSSTNKRKHFSSSTTPWGHPCYQTYRKTPSVITRIPRRFHLRFSSAFELFRGCPYRCVRTQNVYPCKTNSVNDTCMWFSIVYNYVFTINNGVTVEITPGSRFSNIASSFVLKAASSFSSWTWYLELPDIMRAPIGYPSPNSAAASASALRTSGWLARPR